MILVDELTIIEFRGIRNLILKLKGKNFAVSGPNGTGKSGVVDALEFGLTGNISRLSGGGTGTVTLKRHAPHVDFRDDPEKAKVKLTIRIPSLKNKIVTIERNVKDANSPTICPNTPDVLAVLTQLENHPEFVLGRRQLIAYVLATPGKRSEEIQALLQLNKIGDLRATLKTIANSCAKERQSLKAIEISASQNLSKALEVYDLKPEKVLEAVNARRTLLSLPPILTITATTNLNDGLTTGVKTPPSNKINKAEALGDLSRVNQAIRNFGADELKKECAALYSELAELNKNPAIAEGITKEQFLRTAISLSTPDLCPVCDTEFTDGELRNIIEKKLGTFVQAGQIRTQLQKRLTSIISTTQEVCDSVVAIDKHLKNIKPPIEVLILPFCTTLSAKIKSLRNFLPLSEAIIAIEKLTEIPNELIEGLKAIETSVLSLPEPNVQEAARDYLILCNDRIEAWREAARNTKKANERADTASSVHDIYVEESNKTLESVYKEVEGEFGEFYRYINSEDEATFTAKLTPSMGKVGFDVEFYGRGHFPPGAYHSEGHQDGMGLCLYLALMKRLQGTNFRFAVLDDVLMSVDSGHRRAVCDLLKSKFPDTQFVLTTHDEVWLKHMRSIGLVSADNSVRFSNWTPEVGPTEWQNRDVWTEIDSALKANNVREAASLLRYYLEHISKEICDSLRASVEFKGDGRYDLGDLLSPAVRRFRNLLNDGKKAATSWGKSTDANDLDVREKYVGKCLQASNAEQWLINPAIHYNEWANFTVEDFSNVVGAFKSLINCFFCDQSACGSLYFLTFITPKELSTLRCSCGNTNIELKKK